MSCDRSCIQEGSVNYGSDNCSTCQGKDAGSYLTVGSLQEDLACNYPDESLMVADGFDKAFLGVDERAMRVIYSVSKCLAILCKEMPEEDAMEYFEFNVSGAYLGDKTPIWCYDF